MVRSRSWRTEEERRGGNSHPRRLTTNNDARIFTQVTKCHKKAHTHALPPALPLTHLARQTQAPLGAAAAAPPSRRSTCRQQPTAHIQIDIQIPTTNPHKGILSTHGHMPQHESHPRVTTHTATCEHATLHARTTDNKNASNAGEYRTRS